MEASDLKRMKDLEVELSQFKRKYVELARENDALRPLIEKSPIQALERTQPSLPMNYRTPETHTHDYQRYGTITMFAALRGSPVARWVRRWRFW